jgi:hypothetical protein
LKDRERAAVGAVAERFAAKWEEGSVAADAYLTVGKKRVAIDLETLTLRRAGLQDAKPRLRFDKVATRVIEQLQAAADETVPDGMTLLVTITAPIRLPSKTAAVLEDVIRSRGPRAGGYKRTIHSNRVQIDVVSSEQGRAPRMIGFVHNSDADPPVLFTMTRELLAVVGDPGQTAAKRAGERWLVMISARGNSCLQVYRYLYSKLRSPKRYSKVVMMFGDGRLAVLSD